MQAYMLAALRQPDACIHDLPLLGPEDRNAILLGFNATNAQFPSGYCVHELFENQADENPGAVCLALRKLQLSYGDVEALANRLATHLVDIGAGPGVPTGLMMPRCAEMYIAMLAILKVRTLHRSCRAHFDATLQLLQAPFSPCMLRKVTMLMLCALCENNSQAHHVNG